MSDISREIDRIRSLMHYYSKKPDLLSKCKKEVLKNELEQLKALNVAKRHNKDINAFLADYPEYSHLFKE